MLLEARSGVCPVIDWVKCPETLLHPTPLISDPDVLGLNLGQGCYHRCSFCSVRVSPTYPGDGAIRLYQNLVERLNQELKDRGHLPRAVFLSPALDPFPSSHEVQKLTSDVIETLANHGIESWLMTRGKIFRPVLDSILRHRDRVRATIAITTLDKTLNQALEPLTATPEERLEQIRFLLNRGIQVHANLDPLIPGLTDTRDNLEPLLSALAGAGIKQLATGYLFLREGLVPNVQSVLAPLGYFDRVIHEYEKGPHLQTKSLAMSRFLPRQRRQKGYALLTSLASVHGIQVVVSHATNPDFTIPHAKQQKLPRLLELSRNNLRLAPESQPLFDLDRLDIQ